MIAMPKLALTAAAAVGLYVSTLGLPLPESCAAPSPSCGGDLRECLRKSADLRQTTFGGRYVTAEDVARCVEAFNSCIHGGAAGSQAPPAATSRAGGGSGKALPQHVGITAPNSTYDCRVTGEAVRCTMVYDAQQPTVDSWTGDVTGSLSGMTMTGNETQRALSHDDTGCTGTTDYSSAVTWVFDPAGTVSMRRGTVTTKSTVTCSDGLNGSSSDTMPAAEWPATWSAID